MQIEILLPDVFSLNVPVPGEVAQLATELARDLPGATPRRRGEHTLVAKRLGTDDRPPYAIEARAREVLTDQPPVAARVAEVDWFEEPTSGPGPVVYLAVESPGLVALHERLCEVVDPVPAVEDEDYTPHVTVARGGRLDAARRAIQSDIESIEWIIDELEFYDAEHATSAGRVVLE